jgi:hypothetical protein
MGITLEWAIANMPFEKQMGKHRFANEKNDYHGSDIEHS